MQNRHLMRLTTALATLGLLALFSLRVNALPVNENITINGFGNGGMLEIVLTGDTGGDSLMTHPVPPPLPPGPLPPLPEVISFSAVYSGDSTLGPISWSGVVGFGGDLASLLFDAATSTLMSLSALNAPPLPPPAGPLPPPAGPPPPPLFMLNVGSAVTPNSGNLVEISMLGGPILASAPLPGTGVPLPSSLLLIGLGLVAMRRVRRAG